MMDEESTTSAISDLSDEELKRELESATRRRDEAIEEIERRELLSILDDATADLRGGKDPRGVRLSLGRCLSMVRDHRTDDEIEE